MWVFTFWQRVIGEFVDRSTPKVVLLVGTSSMSIVLEFGLYQIDGLGVIRENLKVPKVIKLKVE